MAKTRNSKLCFQCRKDKQKCERSAGPWPNRCDRCRTALHYQCSPDLSSKQYRQEVISMSTSACPVNSPSSRGSGTSTSTSTSTSTTTTTHTTATVNVNVTPQQPASRLSVIERLMIPFSRSVDLLRIPSPDDVDVAINSSSVMSPLTRPQSCHLSEENVDHYNDPDSNLEASTCNHNHDTTGESTSINHHVQTQESPDMHNGHGHPTPTHETTIVELLRNPPHHTSQTMGSREIIHASDNYQQRLPSPTSAGSIGDRLFRTHYEQNELFRLGVQDSSWIMPLSNDLLDSNVDQESLLHFKGEKLFEAIRQGNLEGVQVLLANELSPMNLERVRSQALHEFTQCSDSTSSDTVLAILKQLLEHGARVDWRRPSDGRTILHLAAEQRWIGRKWFDQKSTHMRAFNMILRQGTNPRHEIKTLITALDNKGRSFLHTKLISELFQYVTTLTPLYLTELIAIVNLQDEDGNLPLHYGTLDLDLLGFLLRHSHDVCLQNNKQQTPLFTIMCEQATEQQIVLLLEAGGAKGICQIKDHRLQTILYHYHVDKDIFQQFLEPEYTFNLNEQDINGQTPLIWHTSQGTPAFISHFHAAWSLIVYSRTDVDVNIKDKYGKTALFYLVENLFMFLRMNYLGIQQSEDGLQDLPRYCRMARVLTQLFVNNKADVEAQDNKGMSIIMLARSEWKICLKSLFFDAYAVQLPHNWDHKWIYEWQSLSSDMLVPTMSVIDEDPELIAARQGSQSEREWADAEALCRIMKKDLQLLIDTLERGFSPNRKRRRDDNDHSSSKSLREK